ncbi:GNAT family N-acetyltransferase [Longibacter sp.]|uniref:GNAT family N-acetyltransferase n=1 Tax=Longibacter sp. TaxID=2045415 RepID=UPI003EBDCDA8
MNLRVACSSDLSAIVRIYNQAIRQGQGEGDQPVTAFREPLTVSDRREWFDRHDAGVHPIWVAERTGDVAGWCSLSPYRAGRAALRKATEISYYVDVRHRRNGVASALVDCALRTAPDLGFDTVIAVLLEGNRASVGLLKQCGFAEWGRLPQLVAFDDRRFDHLIYGRHIGPLDDSIADVAG